MNMASRMFYINIYIYKTTSGLREWVSKMKVFNFFKWLTIATAMTNSLFQAITAVYGSPSSEDRCKDSYAYLYLLCIPSSLRKDLVPGWTLLLYVLL